MRYVIIKVKMALPRNRYIGTINFIAYNIFQGEAIFLSRELTVVKNENHIL